MFNKGDIVYITDKTDLHTYVSVEAFYEVMDVDGDYILVTDGNEPFWYHSDCFDLLDYS